jgi:hypothetical protein
VLLRIVRPIADRPFATCVPQQAQRERPQNAMPRRCKASTSWTVVSSPVQPGDTRHRREGDAGSPARARRRNKRCMAESQCGSARVMPTPLVSHSPGWAAGQWARPDRALARRCGSGFQRQAGADRATRAWYVGSASVGTSSLRAVQDADVAGSIPRLPARSPASRR